MRRSAGLLVYRLVPGGAVEVLLVHMGGPYWARKDAGAWSIPKGEHGAEEDPLAAAYREFAEETGRPAPTGEPVLLGTVRQPSGKRVTAFALEGDLDVSAVQSTTFTTEWPPHSGRLTSFPEVDRAGWFSLADAAGRLVPVQVAFLDALRELLEA